MRLTRPQRVGWVIFGLGFVGGGVAVGIMSAVGAAGLGLIIPGFLIFICGSLGKVPNMNIKEGSFDFSKIEEPKPVGPPVDSQAREEIAQLRKELKALGTRLEDYILAHESLSPDDASTVQRLSEMLDAYQELDREIAHREFTGEDHDDGVSLEELRKTREELRARIQGVERYRQALLAFGKKVASVE